MNQINLAIEISSATDVGLVRSRNEENWKKVTLNSANNFLK